MKIHGKTIYKKKSGKSFVGETFANIQTHTVWFISLEH